MNEPIPSFVEVEDRTQIRNGRRRRLWVVDVLDDSRRLWERRLFDWEENARAWASSWGLPVETR